MHCAKRMSGSETVMHPSHSHSFVLRNACREPVPRVFTFLYDTLSLRTAPSPSGHSAVKPLPWTPFSFRACLAAYLTQQKTVRGEGKGTFYSSAIFSYRHFFHRSFFSSTFFPPIPNTIVLHATLIDKTQFTR